MKVVKVVWGIWGLNMLCRLKIKIQNILISFQTPKQPSLSSLLHQLVYLFYKNAIFCHFFSIFSIFEEKSSELVNLVKNRKKKKIYIGGCKCNGGELVNFEKTEKFTRGKNWGKTLQKDENWGKVFRKDEMLCPYSGGSDGI